MTFNLTQYLDCCTPFFKGVEKSSILFESIHIWCLLPFLSLPLRKNSPSLDFVVFRSSLTKNSFRSLLKISSFLDMKQKIDETIVFEEKYLGNGSDEALWILLTKTIENLLICREFVDGQFLNTRKRLGEATNK